MQQQNESGTAGLGDFYDEDTSIVRQALIARLDDPDDIGAQSQIAAMQM